MVTHELCFAIRRQTEGDERVCLTAYAAHLSLVLLHTSSLYIITPCSSGCPPLPWQNLTLFHLLVTLLISFMYKPMKYSCRSGRVYIIICYQDQGFHAKFHDLKNQIQYLSVQVIRSEHTFSEHFLLILFFLCPIPIFLCWIVVIYVICLVAYIIVSLAAVPSLPLS